MDIDEFLRKLKQEYKEMEGDPLVKSRLRQYMQQFFQHNNSFKI